MIVSLFSMSEYRFEVITSISERPSTFPVYQGSGASPSFVLAQRRAHPPTGVLGLPLAAAMPLL